MKKIIAALILVIFGFGILALISYAVLIEFGIIKGLSILLGIIVALAIIIWAQIQLES